MKEKSKIAPNCVPIVLISGQNQKEYCLNIRSDFSFFCKIVVDTIISAPK